MKGRPKLEIKKNDRLYIRIEPDIKKEYLDICKQNKLIYSKRMRSFILKDLKKLKNKNVYKNK